MRSQRILREAELSPAAVRYHVLATVAVMAVIIVGIPFIPFVAAVVYWYYSRYYRRLRVVLTSRELKVTRGIMVVEEKAIPLEQITDLAVYQGPVMRFMGLKGIKVETAGQTSMGTALVSVIGIEDTDGFRDDVLEQRDRIAERDDPAGAIAAPPSGQGAQAQSAPAQVADPVLMETLAEIRDLLRRIESALSAAARSG